jgi:uncharacterized protein (DUF488 family)
MSSPLRVFTIGFTKKSAKKFFTLLQDASVRRVLDVRLNNVSQLAGFSKREDLEYFLREINEIDYHHLPDLAPTQTLLDEYKKNKGDWDVYETGFLKLMEDRKIEVGSSKELFDGGCLLCSEDKAKHCHRRLVAEYLQRKWGEIEIVHLG